MINLSDHFFVPDGAIELRAFTHGLMPRTVPQRMQQFVEDWQRLGVDAWNEVPNHWRPGSGEPVGWWSLPTYLGDHFIAPMLQARPGTCIHQPNVNWTANALFSSPEVFRDKKEVVLTEAEFPSVLHTARRWADRLGLRLRVLPQNPDGFLDRPAVEAAIGAETALVILSHVGFTTGELLPDDWLYTLAKRIHHHGGLFALDGYHATGSIPVDVQAINVDVYFGGLLKEACGSSGNAYVYVRPGIDLTPTIGGWFGDADPFAFAQAPEPNPEVRRRFLGGTTAVAAMYHAVEGLNILLEAGLEAVRADSLEKTGYCIAEARRLGLPLRSPQEPERRGAMVIIEVPHADHLSRYLKHRNVFTDSRQGRLLRLAPFVWNTERELEKTFAILADALETGDYLDAPPHASGPVT